MKPLLFAFMLVCLGAGSLRAAGAYFDFSPTARSAYKKATSMRLEEAYSLLQQMQRSEPENRIELLVENYADFILVMTGDRKEDYKNFNKQFERRLRQLQEGPDSSPYYRYCQAEMRLQAAVLDGRFGNQLSALNQFRKAYTLLEENQNKYPHFIANKKSLGVLHALVGNVPSEYRWAVKFIGGMNGSIEQGLREIEEVLAYSRSNDFIFTEETLVAYSFLQLHLRNQDNAAWQTVRNSSLDPKTNPLAAFALATMAIRVGYTDEAIRILEQCPKGGPYAYFPYMDYLLGLAKLYRLDRDANQPIQNFLKYFQGEHGIKEAYQKLAWYHLVQGNDIGYDTYMGYVKLKGSEQTEPDKSAMREAREARKPDERLTRARLLFDGGYYQRAYDLLKNAAAAYSADTYRNLEYVYRLGRITHKLGRSAEAERYYNDAITKGEKEPWYYACNAALQLGMLYEEKRDYPKARTAYQRCLAIQPQEYATSLHVRAKAGLNRIKKG